MKALLLLALLACDNDAAEYAKVLALLDSKTAICVDLNKSAYGHTALCDVGGESWYCTTAPRVCHVIGDTVRMQRTR